MVFKKAFEILKKKKMQQRSIQAAWVCYIAQEEINGLFKPKKIFAASFKNEILKLEVANSILAGEVRLKSEELKNKINQKAGKDLIKRIRTRIS